MTASQQQPGAPVSGRKREAAAKGVSSISKPTGCTRGFEATAQASWVMDQTLWRPWLEEHPQGVSVEPELAL
jgi:hypothetical protein